MSSQEPKRYTTSVRITVHAIVSPGQVIDFYNEMEGFAEMLVNTGLVKDLQLIEEQVRRLVSWGETQKRIKKKGAQ